MTSPTDAELRDHAEALGARFRNARHTLVTAESCTGGWIAKAMTGVAGSSDWFDSGMVAYSYEAKQALLDELRSGSAGTRGIRRALDA